MICAGIYFVQPYTGKKLQFSINKQTRSLEGDLSSFMRYQRKKIDEMNDIANESLQNIHMKGMQGLAEINSKFAKEMGVEIDVDQKGYDFGKIGKFSS